MQRRLAKVTLTDSRGNWPVAASAAVNAQIQPASEYDICKNAVYTYYIDLERSPAAAEHKHERDLELKKIGLVLQSLSGKWGKSYGSDAVQVRVAKTIRQTYNFILQCGKAIEFHPNIPIPTLNVLPNITAAVEVNAKEIQDIDLAIFGRNYDENVFAESVANSVIPLRLTPLAPPSPAFQEEIVSDNDLTPVQHEKALRLFPYFNADVFAPLHTQTESLHNLKTTINNNTDLLTNIHQVSQQIGIIPDEEKAVWDTINAEHHQLVAHTETQEKALKIVEKKTLGSSLAEEENAEQEAPAVQQDLTQRAKMLLINNYRTYHANEKTISNTKASIIALLHDTAVEYFYKKILMVHKNDPSESAVADFNMKFGNIAKITLNPLSYTIPGKKKPRTRAEATLTLQPELASATFSEIQTYIQNLVSHSTEGYNLVTEKLVKAAEPLKSAYVPNAKKYTFAWQEGLLQMNKYASSRIDHLKLDIDANATNISSKKIIISQCATDILTLQNKTTVAAEQTKKQAARLQNRQEKSATDLANINLIFAENEAKYQRALAIKSNIDALSKKIEVPAKTIIFVEAKIKEIHDNIAVLRNIVTEIQENNTAIKATNSVNTANTLRQKSKDKYQEHITPTDRITEKSARLEQIEQFYLAEEAEQHRLQQQQQEALEREQQQAEAERRETDRQQQAEAERRETARRQQAEIDRKAAARKQQEYDEHEKALQAEEDRKARVIDTAKKIMCSLSDVDFWHKQVKLWGGEHVLKADGKGTITVPKGVKEMIDEKGKINLSLPMTYQIAVGFMVALKKFSAKADQRGSWTCCYPVRNPGTTGSLYNFITKLDIEHPPVDIDKHITNFHTDWDAKWRQFNTAAALNELLLPAHQRSSSASDLVDEEKQVTQLTP